MECNKDKCLKLIEKIKEFPIVWDPSHKDKKNRNNVEDAYKTIADFMECDSATIRKKKEIIFQTYRNYKRKVYKSKPTGTGTDGVYKPTWPLFAILDSFLYTVYALKKITIR